MCPKSATHFASVFIIIFCILKNVGTGCLKEKLILFSERKISVKVEL